MNDLQNFKFETNDIRIIKDDHGEPWWVAKDVCEALDDTNYRRSIQSLDTDEKGVAQVCTPGGHQSMITVNEAGLYSLLFAMQPSKARGVSDEYICEREAKLKGFKRWVAHEVLPSIRKTGGYQTSSIPTHSEALRGWADEMDKTKALEAKITADAPKVAFADALSASSQTILIRDFVKILHQNRFSPVSTRFYEYLRNNGYLMQHGTSHNKPTQKAMDLELFEVNANSITCSSGDIFVKYTSKLTPKGQRYFIDRLIPKMELCETV